MSARNNAPSLQRSLQSLDISPTPAGRFNDRTGLSLEEPPDLATAILELIRSDGLDLKASTEMQIRHEIGLRLDVDETKLRRYEETISEQRKRLDELETAVLRLTQDVIFKRG
jgi:hypothetical protein